jgi:hypothetical protein
MNEWQWIFIIGAFVYIVPAIIFIAFGSGEDQKWSEAENDGGQSNVIKSKSDDASP